MAYEGGEASLFVVLPNKIDGINEFITKIKYPDDLNRAIESMSIEDVMISIPQFRVETSTNLKEVLIRVGILFVTINVIIIPILQFIDITLVHT